MSKKVNFPQGKIFEIIGQSISLRGDDIDTDRITPARFLKCVNFQSLGEQVFADDRSELDGSHPFDLVENKGSSILVVNDNFGCGSSREHAPQALMRWGIRGIIGESFAEIFYGNCLALGIPCGTASGHAIKQIQETIESNPLARWNFNLKEQKLSYKNHIWAITIKKGPLGMLTTGKWDATSQLVAQKSKLDQIKNSLPYLNNFHNNPNSNY